MSGKFWLFQIHESDGNDNWISEAFVRGEDYLSAREAAIDAIREKLTTRGSEIWQEDGDGNHSYYFMLNRKDSCPDGESCEKEHCILDHRSWSVSLYFQEADCSEKEYDKPLSYFHSFEGNILDD